MNYSDFLYLIEKTSKKEKRRMDKFLKEHNYDPKSKTIEIDEKDENGKNKRVKFNITNGPVFSDKMSISRSNPTIDNSAIEMSHKTLKRKPMISHGVFKHEEGHIVDKINPDRFKDEHNKAKKYIDDDKDNKKNEHDERPDEYVADYYSAHHSKYGVSGFNKMINAMKSSYTNIDKEIKKLKKEMKQGINNRDVKKLKRRIQVCKEMLINVEKDQKMMIGIIRDELKNTTNLKERENLMEEIKKIKEFGNEDRLKYEKEIEDYKKEIDKIIKQNYNPTNFNNYVNSQKDATTSKIKSDNKASDNGLELRKKFVNDNITECVNDIKILIYEAEINGEINSVERDILIEKIENKLFEKTNDYESV